MATRIKRIKETLNFASTITNTIATQPSTAGDIVTRVLIDRMHLYNGSGGAHTIAINCGGIMVAQIFISDLISPTLPELVISGSNSIGYTHNTGYNPPNGYAGTGTFQASNFYARWAVPAQFYSQPGESISVVWSGSAGNPGGGTILVSFICIGEY